MSIINLLNQVKNEEIVLPAVQRDFVWPEDKILRLLDSVMRGYPIGTLLFWETYNDIQHRTFVKDYWSSTLYTYYENPHHRKLKFVLDGQQRIASLYTALYGTLHGNALYFGVLSGRDSEDVVKEKYHFYFATSEEAEARNAYVKEEQAKPTRGKREDFVLEHLVKVSDLLAMGELEKKHFVRRLSKTLALTEEAEIRLDINLSNLDERILRDDNGLLVNTIDENLSSDSPYRKSERDILEIYVRMNWEGEHIRMKPWSFSVDVSSRKDGTVHRH